MNNETISLKIVQRLNKLGSQDYDNIHCWQIVEAFNKAQVGWARRQLHGSNLKQQGDGQSKAKIDDLQVLLDNAPMTFTKNSGYSESSLLPDNYFEWKRMSVKAKTDCCPARPMMVYLEEEGNVDILMRDTNKKPSFDWAETFCTLAGNRVKVYTDDLFEVEKGRLIYYHQPRRIEIAGCVDPYTKNLSTVNILCEFKEDIIELIIDETVKIIAGDIESLNEQGIADSQVETNT